VIAIARPSYCGLYLRNKGAASWIARRADFDGEGEESLCNPFRVDVSNCDVVPRVALR
jgi:hypothetical protein